MIPLVRYPYPLLFEPGDRMSREEFLERWEHMPELKNAELIDGVVYMPSPVSNIHSRFDGRFLLVLGIYADATPGCEVLPNATWLMLESAPQPDGALYILPGYGGRTGQHENLSAGAPELAVEVARSTRSYDLGPKLDLYQSAKVQEYVVALTENKRIEWRVLDDGGVYRLAPPDPDGMFRSRVFPGLWLNAAAFWSEDGAGLRAAVDQGLATEEHAQFAEELKRRHEATSRSAS